MSDSRENDICILQLQDHKLTALRLNSLELIERGMVIINGCKYRYMCTENR